MNIYSFNKLVGLYCAVLIFTTYEIGSNFLRKLRLRDDWSVTSDSDRPGTYICLLWAALLSYLYWLGRYWLL